ncbi:MAG: ATP-binding domain-containing protein [Acidimicrobiia bacterium]|nr:ATP-binding domain-containing protein [Acidimicrobiia bacterium]
MGIDNDAVGKALKQEAQVSYPVRDEITGEIVADPDGFPIAELESDDYFELADTMTIEERSMGERAWRFGHVIVDEAQDLTPMQWRMISRRARGLSMTIVGDVAQRTTGEPGSWETLLPGAFGEVNRFDLSTNYRSPEEIEPYANAVLQQLDPDLRPPVSIRQSGHPVVIHEIREADDRSSVVGELALDLVEKVDGGRVAVLTMQPWTVDHPQIRCLTPGASKGMEFDAVIVDEPAEIAEASHGLGLLYVALTRTTDRLTIVHERPLPAALAQL